MRGFFVGSLLWGVCHSVSAVGDARFPGPRAPENSLNLLVYITSSLWQNPIKMRGDQDQLSPTCVASRTRGRPKKQFLISYFSGITAEEVLALMGVSAQPIKRRLAERRLLLHKETLEQADTERTALR